MKGRARHEKLIKTERGKKIDDRVEKIAKYERSTALISIFFLLMFYTHLNMYLEMGITKLRRVQLLITYLETQ